MEKSVENLEKSILSAENLQAETCGKFAWKILWKNRWKILRKICGKSFFFLAIDRIRSMENLPENLSGKSSGKFGGGKSERKTWKIRDTWKIC
jgi:hypothetical protein